MRDAKGLNFNISVHMEFNSTPIAECSLVLNNRDAFLKRLLDRLKMHLDEELLEKIPTTEFRDFGNDLNLGKIENKISRIEKGNIKPRGNIGNNETEP